MNAADANRRPAMTSPAQAAAGAFFGGSIALVCFVRSNYVAIGDTAAARRTLAIGILLVLACNVAFALGILLPTPARVFLDLSIAATPFAFMIASYEIVRRQIASLDVKPVIRSNLRAFAIASLCMLASAACALVSIIVALVALFANSGFRT